MARGFTLIEIIMVIVLIGIALPTLILAIAQGVKDSARSELITVSTHIAQGKMDRITAVKFLNHSGYEKLVPSVFPAETATVNGVSYNVYTNYSTVKTGVRMARVMVTNTEIPDVNMMTWFTNYSTIK